MVQTIMKMNMKRKMTVLGISSLLLFSITGCSNYQKVSFVDDIKKPVRLEEKPSVSPTYPDSIFRVHIARIIKPINLQAHRLSEMKSKVWSCEARKGNCQDGFLATSREEISVMDEEVLKVEEYLRQAKPPVHLMDKHGELLREMESYRKVLKTMAEGRVTERDVEIARNKATHIGDMAWELQQ